MHAFATAVGLPHLTVEQLGDALGDVARHFDLDPSTAWHVSSPSGELRAAGVHHGAVAAPRRYVHRDEPLLTAFDGLPVDPTGARAAHDAAELARGWDEWAGSLEGQFCALRLDLGSEVVEVRTDTFGLVPVFAMSAGGGTLLSNSVHVIRRLLGAHSPDPLGVSTMVGLGWACARRTLLADVRALTGGSVHTVTTAGITTSTHFGPAQARRPRTDLGPDQLVDFMETIVESATREPRPVRCAITAGRDTRLLLALMRSRGVVADFYTIGRGGDEDVLWAQRLARDFGLRHQAIEARLGDQRDWTATAELFLAQTDGLSNLNQLVDYAEPAPSRRELGVKVWGIGSEIGRAGPGDTPISSAAIPLLGSSLRLQEKLLAMKADAYRPLMTSEAQALLDRSIADFAAARLEEGWKVNELAELFFVFERVGCHGAAGPRRAAARDDLFSPFCSRTYAEYCLSLSPAQRYVELPYHQLLSRSSPELYSYPFEIPLRPARPIMSTPRAMRRLGRVALRRAGLTLGAADAPAGRAPFVFEWFEQRLELLDDLFAEPGSPLWELIDRNRVRALLHGSSEARYPHLEGLLRAAGVAWYFHGRTGS
ncbi:MAG: class II glutamine amidotransferase domain-containing protein [Solirubrobacteraceae bacterium]